MTWTLPRSAFAALFSLFLAAHASAQLPMNVAAGPTFATLSGDDAPAGYGSKTGFFVAAGTGIPLTASLMIEPSVAYVQKGWSYPEGGELDLALDYLEIIAFLTAYLPLGESVVFSVGAGPEIAFNIGCDDNGVACPDTDEPKGTDYGVVAVGNLLFPLSETLGLAVGGGADFSMTDVFETGDAANRAYFVFAGLGFTVGG
jgi:hypothetical protein